MTPTLNLRQAASILGIGVSTAYAAARNNDLPFPVLKIGGRFVVPAKPLAATLGMTTDELNQAVEGLREKPRELRRPVDVDETLDALADA